MKTVDIKNIKEIDIDGIVEAYQSGMMIKEISEFNDIEFHKVVKILVTIGVFSNDTYDRIVEMRECGKNENEIMDALCIKQKTLNMYTPYKKGIYNLQDASKNALKIRRFRDRKQKYDNKEN